MTKDVHASLLLSMVRVAIAAWWAIVGFFVLLAAVPENPLRLSYLSRWNVLLMFPEGWGFFTRNPREADHLVYSMQGDRLTLRNASGTRWSEWLGLRRDSRVRSSELEVLLRASAGVAWAPCSGSLQSCVKQASPEQLQPIASVKRVSSLKLLCGTLIIQRQEPVPWAWSKSPQLIMPSQFTVVESECQ